MLLVLQNVFFILYFYYIGRSCEYNVHIFLLLETILCFLTIIIYLIITWNGEQISIVQKLEQFYIFLLIFIFARLVWFVLGSYWLYSTDNETCNRRLLWDYTASYYIINYIVLAIFIICNILNAKRPLVL